MDHAFLESTRLSFLVTHMNSVPVSRYCREPVNKIYRYLGRTNSDHIADAELLVPKQARYKCGRGFQCRSTDSAAGRRKSRRPYKLAKPMNATTHKTPDIV